MVIRKATPKDVEECIGIEHRIWPQYSEMGSTEVDLRKQARDDGYMFLVYEEKGKILGFITIDVERWNSTLLIERLEVDKEHRQKGIGSKLISEVERIARKRKNLAIRLFTGTTFKEQQEYYKKRGFKITGTIKDFYIGEKDPKNRDAFFMSKKL